MYGDLSVLFNLAISGARDGEVYYGHTFTPFS